MKPRHFEESERKQGGSDLRQNQTSEVERSRAESKSSKFAAQAICMGSAAEVFGQFA